MSSLQSYTYEDLHPIIEIKDTPEAKLLNVHLPDDFTRADIGAKVEYDFGRVRVFGERSIGSNKKIRFNEKYQVPSHCNIDKIRAKIDGKIVTITIPKIPGKIPQDEEQESTQENNNNVAEVNDQNGQENNSHQDSKSTSESKEEKYASSQEAQKGQDEISQNNQVTKVDSKVEAYRETPASQEPIPQKGLQDISQKEFVPQKDPQENSQKVSTPQKSQEEISQKPQITKVESKGEPYHETTTTSEVTQKSMPQKGQEGISNKATDTKDAELQTEEKTPSLKEENKENQKVVKEEETKEHLKKTIESEKPHVVDGSSPKEIKNDKFCDDAEKKSDKKGIHESATRTRIKDVALSTTQAVTNYAKRFNEEDKQNLIYTGATILVVGLGVYASYKYCSSRRPYTIT